MARAGFYNENEYRDYPFLTQVEPRAIVAEIELSSGSSASAQPLRDLPHETIVDFGAIMGVDSGFRTGQDFIWLRRILRQDPYLLFEFRTTAPDASSESLYFLRLIDDPEFTSDWAESRSQLLPDPFPTSASSSDESSASSESSNPFCTPGSDAGGPLVCGGSGCDAPRWEGFLITGLFTDLLDTLGDGDSLLFVEGLWVIEPARIQNLNQSYVRSLNLANLDRTHATPPEECSSVSVDDNVVYPNAICLQGDLQLKEGFNCHIRQENLTNTFVISGVVGGGVGLPCDEIPLFDGEVPPDDSSFLSGGPGCGDVIRTINGKTGPVIRLLGGAGIQVFDSPVDSSTLFVDADLSDFALCLQGEPGPDDPCFDGVLSSSSSLSSSSGGV
jgi:hypothetical protein